MKRNFADKTWEMIMKHALSVRRNDVRNELRGTFDGPLKWTSAPCHSFKIEREQPLQIRILRGSTDGQKKKSQTWTVNIKNLKIMHFSSKKRKTVVRRFEGASFRRKHLNTHGMSWGSHFHWIYLQVLAGGNISM